MVRELMFWILLALWQCSLLALVVIAADYKSNLERVGEIEKEYCTTEEFKPKCNPGEVVVVSNATYGIMNIGRCIATDYGYVGCNADVVHHLDDECSGQMSCSVNIPDVELDRLGTCPKEFKSFLKASYMCFKVRTEECHQCVQQSSASVVSPYGYLASVYAISTDGRRGCGSSLCPWLIEAQPGQTINLTLYDFHDTTSQLREPLHIPEICIRLAVIREKSSREIPVCGGKGRARHVYTSVSHSVQVFFVNRSLQKGQAMIYYEVFGCADSAIETSTNMELNRDGALMKVHCKTTGVDQVLKCVNNKWQGEVQTCPEGEPETLPSTGFVALHKGILVAVVIGIALVVGILILVIGIICLKRQHPPYNNGGSYFYPPHHSYDYAMDTGQWTGQYMAPKPYNQPSEPSKYQPVLHRGPHGHRRIQSRPLPSLPNITEASASGSSKSDIEDPRTCLTVEIHQPPEDRRYLTNPRPPSTRQASVSSSANNSRASSKTDPQYFVLETDGNRENLAAAQRRQAARQAAARPLHTTSSDSVSDKSSDHENVEINEKETSHNSSCHEIPLRPSRDNVNNVTTENTTGKTSWP